MLWSYGGDEAIRSGRNRRALRQVRNRRLRKAARERKREAARAAADVALIRLALNHATQGARSVAVPGVESCACGMPCGDMLAPESSGREFDKRTVTLAPDIIGRSDDPAVVDARHMLHKIYSSKACPAEVAHEVEQYFALVSRLIWRAADPEAATRAFFARPQGRSAEKEELHLLIAAAVQRLLDQNEKYVAAVARVAEDHCQTVPAVKSIHHRADKGSPAFKFALKGGSLRV